MLVKISQHGHVIIPPFLLEELGLGPGDTLELEETEDGFALKLAEKYVKPPPKPVDWSNYKRQPYELPPGTPPLDMGLFREAVYDPAKYRELYREKYGEAGHEPANSRD